MKTENSQKESDNEQEGFPIIALLMVSVLGISVLAIVLKIIGLF
jgi:hypothetical protein